MLRQFTLQPNEDKRIQFEGRFLVVTQATGPVELSIGGTTPITVDEKDRIHLRGESPNDRAIRIKNVSGGVNELEIHTSDLLVDKRTGVDVKNAIQIADDQLVGIDPGANIVQSIIQNPVRIDSNENTIKIEKSQCVGIDIKKNTVKSVVQNPVRIDPNENAVKIVKGQCVGIDPKKNQVDVIRKSKEFKTLPTAIFEAPANSPPDFEVEHVVNANHKRDLLVVTADANNLAPIWIGGEVSKGVPLFAGDRLFLEGQNYFVFVGKADHIMYIAEIVWLG